MTPNRHVAPTGAPLHINPGHQAAFGRLAALLQMEERLRHVDKKELPFIAVNETRLLVPYRQAVLWRGGRASGAEVMAVSGLAVPDKNSPYIQWLSALHKHLSGLWVEKGTGLDPMPFNATDLPPEMREDWADWLPSHGLFVPMPAWPLQVEDAPSTSSTSRESAPPELSADVAPPESSLQVTPPPEPSAQVTPPQQSGASSPETPAPAAPKALPKLFGALALFSQHPFPVADLRTARHLAGAYGQALSLAYAPKDKKLFFQLSRRAKYLVAAALLLALFPARQTVLAPAEVIAMDPWPVRAPIEGVVESILVSPNARVSKGDALLKLDTTELETRLAVAAKSLGVAKAELRQTQQQALVDREAKLRLAYLTGRQEQLEAEKAYVESLIERAVPQSPVDGVALVDAPEEWAGKPVSLGQRIMTVADPRAIRLEIFLPSDDYMPQNPGDEINFFSNTNPAAPIKAVIYQVGFQNQETPQAGMTFRLRADFSPGEDIGLRLGLRGSAKLYGPRAPLAYNLLRKPLAKLRQWIGV